MKAMYELAAPAKLNLFLHVVGRRPDGYHLLQSAFMLIDWCDLLHVELRADGRLSREDLGVPLPSDDLTLRAARALQSATGTQLGAHIALEKRIPMQAGMGGGSSDAATCLLALNRLWDLNLPLQRLQQIGLGLGADVPFFLLGRHAWVEGIGEQLSALELPPAIFVVLKPAAGLDTPSVFADAQLQRNTAPAIISGFAADPYGFGRNDLQPVAQRICPQVDQAMQWLAKAGMQGRMTGSGSAVFAEEVQSVDWPEVPQGWSVRRCRNLAIHPLEGWAASDIS